MDFLSNIDLIGGLAGSDLGWIGGVLTLVLGGLIGPAIITLFVNLLRLPVAREAVRGFGLYLGKTISLTLTRWFGKYGQMLEDGLQEVKNDFNKAIDDGLDRDDKK